MNKTQLIRLITEARKSLPHITTMDHKDFHNLVRGGSISLGRVTEKTDGSAYEIGHDQHGFYSRYSGSGKEKMRSKMDYMKRAARRARETGKPLNLGAARAFGETHEKLANNSKLVGYLKQKAETHPEGDSKLRGELFHRPSAQPAETHPNPAERHGRHVYFVGTSYHRKHLGKHGAFVVHTGLEDNQEHDVQHLQHLGDEHMSFHHDVLDIPHTKVDVSKERDKFGSLDRHLLGSRTTKKNKEAKQAEMSKLDTIRQAVSKKVDKHVNKLGISKSKWGQGTPEGHVIHPPKDNPDQPRFKITSDAFRQFKADTGAQEALKKRIGKK